MKPHLQNFTNDVLQASPNVQMTQHVAQGSYPGGLNGGACNSITSDWIRIGSQHGSMSQASHAFGQRLDNNMGDIIQNQQAHEASAAFLKQEGRQLKADVDALNQLTEEINADVPRAQRGELSPKELRTLNKKIKFVQNGFAEVGERQAELKRLTDAEHARPGGGLPHTRLHDGAPIKDDFPYQLHDATNKNGFYTLHLHNPGGEGHVVGLQAKDGEYKFMDPNTGEFKMNDKWDLNQVMWDHVDSIYRKQGYDSFSLDHFQG